jgi:two-component system, OmpR family, aerobic respiration control sensor histidine kinase ArcB
MDLFEIYDQLSDIIILTDANDNILALNRSAKNYFSPINVVGKNYFSVCSEINATTDSDINTPSIDWKIVENGANRILIGVKQNTAEIYLSSLLNASYEGLNVYWNDREHRIVLCNASQLSHLKAQNGREIYGKPLLELVSRIESDPEIARQITETVSENNRQVMLTQKPAVFEEVHLDKHVFLSYKTPYYDSAGNVQGVLGISTEITRNKMLQLELEKSKHATDLYLESILMSSPSNIYWLDKEGRAIGCNDQQAKCVGLDNRHDIIGTTVFDLAARLGWDPELAKQIREQDLQVMNSKKPSISRETVILDGKVKTYLGCKSPMLNDKGEAIGILGISTDITNLLQIEKELDQARQKAENASRYKSEFIANISHDIRTPLVGISGVGGWLLENIPAEFKPDILGIVHASNELLALLNNVIRLTKLESDEQHQQVIEAFDLYELILRMTQLFAPLVTYKNLTLNLIYPEHIPRRFKSMPSLIQRILLNLISNALKFTSHGGVTLWVSRDNEILTSQPEDFPLLLIVEDTGIGIPESKYDAVFEEFHRLNPSYQGQYRGSGLGLSIVKNFVEHLGGKIWVTSEPGKGSRFFVRLPMPMARSGENAAMLTTDGEIEDDLKICLDQSMTL